MWNLSLLESEDVSVVELEEGGRWEKGGGKREAGGGRREGGR